MSIDHDADALIEAQIAIERQALSAVPVTAIDERPLRPLERRDLARIFSSAAIDAESPAVEKTIGDLVVIEDMKTPGVNPGDRRALYYLVRGLNVRNVLEVGTNVGASAMHIAAALRENAASGEPRCSMVTVDVQDVIDGEQAPWRQASLPRSPRETIELMGLADSVSFFTMDSVEFLETHDRQFDFIFLDGDHGAATVYREIPRALRRLRKGGVVVLHDVFPHHRPLWGNGSIVPGPLLAVERLQREGAGIDLIPLGAVPWPTKLGTCVTSLAVLTRR